MKDSGAISWEGGWRDHGYRFSTVSVDAGTLPVAYDPKGNVSLLGDREEVVEIFTWAVYLRLMSSLPKTISPTSDYTHARPQLFVATERIERARCWRRRRTVEPDH